MIRLTLILLLGILATSGLQAQFLVGPKVGVNYGTMFYSDRSYKDEVDVSWVLGFNAGFVVNYEASETFSVHSELYYSQKGRRVRIDGPDFVDDKATFHHVDLPILFRMSFPLGFAKRWYLNVGPHATYWLQGTGKLSANELDEIFDGDINYTFSFSGEESLAENKIPAPNANRFQLGLDFGTGVMVDITRSTSLMIDIRYNWTHTNIGEAEDNDIGLFTYEYNFEGANNTILLSVAYLWGFNPIEIRRKGKSTLKVGRRRARRGR